MADLTVEFSGVTFKNPILASPGPPTNNLRRIRKCVENGVGGVVFKTAVSNSLEIMRKWPRPRFKLLKWDVDIPWKVPSSFVLYSIEQGYHGNMEAYCRELEEIKRTVDVPVGGSIACVSHEEWTSAAKMIEKAGADFLELDISCPHEPEHEGRVYFKDVVSEVVKVVADAVNIPVIPKLTFQVEDLVSIAKTAEKAGARGITIANRIAGIDIDVKKAKPIMHGSYAGMGGPWSIYYGLRWVSEIAPNVSIPISATGGIMSSEDVIKYLMVGATNVQICTSIIVSGYEVIGKLVGDLEEFMDENGYSSVQELIGIALPNIVPLDKIEREPPVNAEVDHSKCIGCGFCVARCLYEAISISEGKASVDKDKCDGCGLCADFCPVKAIKMVRRE